MHRVSETLRPNYRPEIDGLRALAVTAVVLYHARLPGISGGYAGVDVFFVISGYVIIKMLLRQQQAGAIQWQDFFARRVRRLLPLLCFTQLAALVAGYWLLSPFGALQDLSKSSISATAMLANVYFWHWQGSYFSPAADQLPLLHLWSLGVEEQFYLGLPMIFLLAAKWRSLGLARLLFALSAISLALTVWGFFYHPSATFYLPAPRAWEFAAGSLAALTAAPQGHHRQYELARWACLAGITICWFTGSKDASLSLLASGSAAAFTATLLWLTDSGGERLLLPALLRHRALVWLGQRSYAWYLLHWPVLVFYRSYFLENVSLPELLCVVAMSLWLAHICHRYLELPLRYSTAAWAAGKRLAILTVISMISVIAVSFWLGVSGASANQDKLRWQHAKMATEEISRSLCPEALEPTRQPPLKACVAGDTESPNQIYLWGDSHAGHLGGLLSGLATNAGFHLMEYWDLGCPPLHTWHPPNWLTDTHLQECQAVASTTIQAIERSSKQNKHVVAVMAARWEPYLGQAPISAADAAAVHTDNPAQKKLIFGNALNETITSLLANKVQIILVAPIPELIVSAPACLARFTPETCWVPRSTVEAYRAPAMQLLRNSMQHWPNVQLVDPIEALCDADFCRVGSRQAPWYFDDDHLSLLGAQRLKPQMEAAIRAAIKRSEMMSQAETQEKR